MYDAKGGLSLVCSNLANGPCCLLVALQISLVALHTTLVALQICQQNRLELNKDCVIPRCQPLRTEKEALFDRLPPGRGDKPCSAQTFNARLLEHTVLNFV
jgi:hypothetical protein